MFQDYANKVADYISMEYSNTESDFYTNPLTDDERWTIKQMLTDYYEVNNSINNAATDVINYIRRNRDSKRKHLS